MQTHKTVSREEWLQARRALLAKEKAHLRAHDEIARLRREMPWVKVDKTYVFEGPDGKETLSDLFAGRSQLIVKHFMLGPGWQEGCVGCSFGADQMQGSLVHLINHDVMVVAISRAPYDEIAPFHRRMGWPFKWVSSHGNDFNFDYHVSFTPEELKAGKAEYNYRVDPIGRSESPGVSVFLRDGRQIYHTYSAYARGLDMLNVGYHYMDLVPKGRDEESGPFWLHRRDEYPD